MQTTTEKKKRFPQELFAEALWTEWQYRRIPASVERTRELLRRFNLKPKKATTDNDLDLLVGRALKGVCSLKSAVQIEAIASETDRICVIADWEDAVATYRKS